MPRYPERVRALLIVNPRATSTTQLRREVITHALASQMDLEVVETRYRGHAASLAAAAVAGGHELVLTLGGDGTVNEAVNGLLLEHNGLVPALAALPGGNANVFTRSLGLPTDPVDATGRVIEALEAGRSRRLGLGRIDPGGRSSRYFTFNAGLGLDAEVVRVIEGLRARGRSVTPRLYLWTALRQFYTVTDRRHPALTLERRGQPPVGHLFFGIVSNTAPWTYLGRPAGQPQPSGGLRHRPRPVRAAPAAHGRHAESAAPDVRQPGRPTQRPGRAQPARPARVRDIGQPAGGGAG